MGGTSPGCHRPRKPLHRRRGAVPARALQKGRKHPFPPHPPRQWEDPPERPRGEDPPSKGRSKGGKNRQGKHQARGLMTGGIRQRSHGIPRGGKPTFPWMQDIPERLRQWVFSSCCTLGRMMREPWMPTSMPTTRPSRSTFGRWISGERAESWARTCWARSLTRRCAPWPCIGRWPQLQDVEHPQVVPQTGWPTAGEGQQPPGPGGTRRT